MRADLCVVAPCFNEGANVRRLVRRVGEALKDHPGGFELALVDDASRDDTWAQIEEAARAFPFVVPLRHRVNRGIVEGWRTGLSATKAPRIVTIDADMQYRPEDIPRLVRAMNASGADFVQGWRQTQVKRGFLRVFLTGGLSLFLNLAFGMRLKDNKSGFVLYRRDAMERILDFRAPFRHYQHFIAIAAHRLGLRIVQIPITFDAREHGQSFITNPVRFAIGALVDLPRALLHFGPFHRLMQGARVAMCGIAGLYSPAEKLQPGRIAPMVEILTHRGPDEGGVYESERVHLGSRRLKVIDLVSGTQPIYSEDRGVVVVYNGEIFNYRQLRSELQAAGHTFATQSDTEVLVHGYEQWGERLVDRLNGQFAFAIWDGKRLFLARDRMGEKPLYYARDGRRLIFASEIKAILKEFPSAPAVDESFWVFDTEVLGRTIFEGIREVPPAHLLTFDGDVLDVRAYWQIPAGPIADRSESDLVEELRTLLIDAVNIRMVADVPVGMFLSGGIDSAAIACIARPETAFSCHFPLGESFEEIEYAKLVAERIGARHTIVRPTPEQFRDRLGRIVWYLDQPIATASTISEFLLAESARDQGIKVILGGQGADEIFAGYVRYLFMLAEERLAQVEELANYHALARFFWNKFAFGDPAERYFELIRRTQPEDRDAYVHLVRDLFSRHEALLDKMGHFDALVSLPSLLTMNDRACAAHGLENRCPFLDHRIVEFAFTLPPTMKIDGYTTKAILRKALRGIVPDPILDRKDKKGLVVPFQQWLNGPLRPWADALVDKLGRRLDLPSGFNGRGGFDRSLYTRVCLELWFENFFPDWPNVS